MQRLVNLYQHDVISYALTLFQDSKRCQMGSIQLNLAGSLTEAYSIGIHPVFK